MYSLSVNDFFMVAHSLKGKEFGQAQNLHGATFEITTEYKVKKLNNLGIVIDVVVASGLESDVLFRLTMMEKIGTFFPATGSKVESRKRWMLSGLSTKGRIVVDEGAVRVLKDEKKSLLPAGVILVEGSFSRGDIVAIRDLNGNQIAVGITNYGSDDLDKIKGHQSKEVEKMLGYQLGEEVVHRNNMVSLKS